MAPKRDEGPTPTVSEAPTQTDIVRTISLNSKPRVTAGLSPALTYGGGPLIRNAKVFTIFWGPHWNADPLNTQMRDLNVFFDFIFDRTGLIKKLKRYSAPGWKITGGQRVGTADEMILQTLGDHIRMKGHSVTDEQIQQMLLKQVGVNKQFPKNNLKNNPNLLYFVYLPPKVKLVRAKQESCKKFCGYHNHINKKIFYAAVPYPDCKRCKGNLDPFAALTLTSSHELWEAITDPIPPEGWYDQQREEEICDSYEWRAEQIKSYRVQFLPEPRLVKKVVLVAKFGKPRRGVVMPAVD